jgi:hypothetical protein
MCRGGFFFFFFFFLGGLSLFSFGLEEMASSALHVLSHSRMEMLPNVALALRSLCIPSYSSFSSFSFSYLSVTRVLFEGVCSTVSFPLVIETYLVYLANRFALSAYGFLPLLAFPLS